MVRLAVASAPPRLYESVGATAMIPYTTHHFRSALAMIRGMREIFRAGIKPRGLLFVALDDQGDAHLTVAQNASDVDTLKVGTKLALPLPFPGRMFYLDAVHPLAKDTAVVNGDRRIGRVASMVDVAALVSGFVQQAGDRSVFFGCTPHQPGSWWVKGEEATPLHDRGFVDIVPAPDRGLIARRTVDDGLYYLPQDAAARGDLRGWQRVFRSPLGNVLLIERRVLGGRLVLSCQDGLIEVNIDQVPDVHQTGQIDAVTGYAVVGRVTNGAFAVTAGAPRAWGFDQLKPAMLVGSRGCTFEELGELLLADEEMPTAIIPPK